MVPHHLIKIFRIDAYFLSLQNHLILIVMQQLEPNLDLSEELVVPIITLEEIIILDLEITQEMVMEEIIILDLTIILEADQIPLVVGIHPQETTIHDAIHQ